VEGMLEEAEDAVLISPVVIDPMQARRT
jgi:hypothetical protein